MKIVLEIDGKDIILSMEEARKVYEELESIFGKKIPYTGIRTPFKENDFTLFKTPHTTDPINCLKAN